MDHKEKEILTIYLAKKDDHWLPYNDDDISKWRKGSVNVRKLCYNKPLLIPLSSMSVSSSGIVVLRIVSMLYGQERKQINKQDF
jgi:hypothetical protein